jgi:hypothetical protein
MGGNGITQQEMLFLVQNSEGLLRNLDKQYINLIFGLLDPELVDKVEWQIAEKVMQKH